SQLAELSKSIQEMRQEMKRLSIEQEKLHKIMEPQPIPGGVNLGSSPPPPTMAYAQHPLQNYGQYPHQSNIPVQMPTHYATGQFQMPPQPQPIYAMPQPIPTQMPMQTITIPHQQHQHQQQQFQPFQLTPAPLQMQPQQLNGAGPSLSQLHL